MPRSKQDYHLNTYITIFNHISQAILIFLAVPTERIIAFRKEHGAFHRTEEVMNVKGVGEKSFVQLKPFLTLSVPAAAK